MERIFVVNGIEVPVDLPGVGELAFEAVGAIIGNGLARPKIKARDAIKDAFLMALKLCPTANASDLWHQVVYRQYLTIFKLHRKKKDPDQSWKKSSGEALELAVEEIYVHVLAEHNVRIQMLIGEPKKRTARGNGH